MCYLFPVKNVKLSEEHIKALNKSSFDSFIEKKALFIAFMAFLMGLSYSSVLAFLSSYVKVIDLVQVSSFIFRCLCLGHHLYSTTFRQNI